MLDVLDDAGVAIAWVRTMPHSALYLEEDRIMVLNSQCPWATISEAVGALLSDEHEGVT